MNKTCAMVTASEQRRTTPVRSRTESAQFLECGIMAYLGGQVPPPYRMSLLNDWGECQGRTFSFIFNVVCLRCTLSVFNHTQTHTYSLTQCSLSSGNFERGARGRLVCPQSHTCTHIYTLWYPNRGSRGRPVCFQSHILLSVLV